MIKGLQQGLVSRGCW